ncbi:MAG TPA: anti-sigma factor [Streptosporangiaceae bacterium]|nr:anti-sigma factor [Streptosporangiaceae bacterium]
MATFRFRRPDPHTLAGAYALDALGGTDRARFERHLSACPSCSQETKGLREAATRLAATTAARAPDGLRDRVLAAAARTRQNPPSATEVKSAWPGRRWGMAIACGVLAVALAVGGLAFHTQQQLSQEQARARAIAAVLNAPDATMLTAIGAPRGTATVVMSHQDRALVFTAARLPALPSSERYELWLMGSSGPRAAGMLPAAHAGLTAPVIVSGLRPGDKVALTVEPAAGARTPSPRMIVMLPLPS